VAASLAAPLCFGAAADRQQAQAKVLDHAEFLCDNCLLAASQYYYCFEAGSQILIGYQSTPVMNYTDKSKNYLAAVRPSYTPWGAPGQAVPISYDDKHIWVSRPETPPAKQTTLGHLKAFAFWASHGDSKQVKMKRSNIHDIFLHNEACRADSGKAH
jgi:hypothetical protein